MEGGGVLLPETPKLCVPSHSWMLFRKLAAIASYKLKTETKTYSSRCRHRMFVHDGENNLNTSSLFNRILKRSSKEEWDFTR